MLCLTLSVLFARLCARWGVHACVCLCVLVLFAFNSVCLHMICTVYDVRTLYKHCKSDWLIAWIEYFFNAFVFFISFIHLFTINVCRFFHASLLVFSIFFCCWIDFSLSTFRMSLCNGHLINDTRWWNAQYNYSIMCDFSAVLVKSWTLNLHTFSDVMRPRAATHSFN